MSANPLHSAALAVCLALSLGACGAARRAPAPAEPADRADFSGFWELDYGRSDKVEERLTHAYRELRRQAEQRARTRRHDGNSRAAAFSVPATRSDGMAAIVRLARLADYITTSQILEIEQSQAAISVWREDSFTLNCRFGGPGPVAMHSEFGSERCGWDARQLVFAVSLPEGTRINHRLSLAPDGRRLQIATEVARGAGRSFTLNRVYNRFEPLPSGFECEYTLSRGNVCRRASS